MKALLLAGGLGTRLRPLTDDLPKPMVPIMGRPLLERIILNLKKSGVDEVVISTYYKSQYIEDYFKPEEDYLGVKIHYITEESPLGTGGAIKNAEKFFDDTFLILNSDIVSDIDYADLIKYHKRRRAQVTIASIEVRDTSQYGVIEFDEKGFITAFKEKPKPGESNSKYINAGVYVFEPEVLKEIPENTVVSVERETYPKLLEKEYRMAIYKFNGYWIDIGTIDKYKKVHEDILKGKSRFVSTTSSRGIILGDNVKIHPTAKVMGPVYIGNNTEIDAYATVGPYTVIGNNCRIGQESKVSQSVLWDNVKVCRLARLENAVITSECIVEVNMEVKNTVFTANRLASTTLIT
ncbi:MAG TPA: NDP-sugar synthase [Clostridia bacterium]|nr:NDP-sugar synthase [Clostridia bacterium]